MLSITRPFPLLFLSCLTTYGQAITVSGTIKEKNTLENIPYVLIVDTHAAQGTCASNAYGFYSIIIQPNTNMTLRFTHIGYKGMDVTIKASKDTIVNVELEPIRYQLNELVVTPVSYTHLTLPTKRIV